ncbi:DUF2326 domain-containing protein [Streptococcus equi]|uniref:DUF2326 domain-containing protein n=1 Tax=Streptococcus equi TaxID=1336 RepID=UPI0013F68A50|nr:DUF2326 domain-containing protein [Streptococcus equi]
MLKEISCDKFIENGQVRPPIQLHMGLNAVIGANDGANSIGKSTFLMIIDFIFGGNDYTKKATDIIENIGNHTIKFEFEFQETSYYFSRSTDDVASFWECDKNYHPKKRWSRDDYCHFLNEHYKMNVPSNRLRSSVSPFIRVWGRTTLNQDKPLKASSESPDKQGITSLLELFNRYNEIEKQANIIEEAKAKQKVFASAQKYKFIAVVENKTNFKDNEKRIQELEIELKQLSKESDNGLVDIDSLKAQQLSDLQRQLSEIKKQKTRILSQKRNFEAELNPEKTRLVRDFESLQQFFPEANIQKLSDIEKFHKQLTTVLKNEYKESAKELEFLLRLTNEQIKNLEEKISSISNIPNVSQSILEQYATLQTEITQLKDSNQNFLIGESLRSDIRTLRESFEALIKQILLTIQSTVNKRMTKINDEIYHGTKTSPQLILNSATSYDFFTPQDRGTGSEYKGLIVFDLAMLQETSIPIIAHDSVLLKQIQDEALEGILSYYSKQKKQVFIALDKEESYSIKSQEYLNNAEVLRLFPNGGELFGRAWNTLR